MQNTASTRLGRLGMLAGSSEEGCSRVRSTELGNAARSGMQKVDHCRSERRIKQAANAVRSQCSAAAERQE